jgi:hypothetical protein
MVRFLPWLSRPRHDVASSLLQFPVLQGVTTNERNVAIPTITAMSHLTEGFAVDAMRQAFPH